MSSGKQDDMAGFEEDLAAGDEFSDPAEGGAGEEGDFAEEDWEAYDEEEEYLDDSDGEGKADPGLERRRKIFNRSLMGGGVALALIVGGMTMFGGDKAKLGQPVMEQVSQAVPVAETEKVEFHAETKLDANDSLGVKYGEEKDTAAAPEEEKKPQHGMLHDSAAMEKIRNRQSLETKQYTGDKEFDSRGNAEEQTQQAATGTQPVPVSPAEEAAVLPDSAGLMPLPDVAAPEAQASAQLPTANDIAKQDVSAPNAPPDDDLAAAEAGMTEALADNRVGSETGLAALSDAPSPAADDLAALSDEPGRAAAAPSPDAATAAINDKLDLLVARMEDMEQTLGKIDELQDSVSGIEERIAKLEKNGMPPVARKAPAPRASESVSSYTAPRAPDRAAETRPGWVLKSAQPGTAMVAKAGESEIYTVTVGEKLQGLGTVTAVFVENGRWIVQATNGRVVQ